MSALGKVVRAGVGRRRTQTVVLVLTTLVAVAASVVATGVLTASRAPFEQAMAEWRGAHLAAQFDGGEVSERELAVTARASGVTAAAGPFRTLRLRPRTVSASDALPAGVTLPALSVTGRADPAGPVDRLRLTAGRWVTGPGEIVLAGDEWPLRPGARLALPGAAGGPTLTVVGLARSVTGTADAWVTPAQAAALSPGSGAGTFEMLYRFRHADTDTRMSAARDAIAGAVPPGALTGTRSHLVVRQEQLANALAFVPFVAAFGVLGLILSVLIVGIVVSGAVGAATRRIGVLKSLGLTPAQVVRAYVAQALVPAALGCALGVALGNVLAWPVLGDLGDVYGGASASVPWWVDVAAPAATLALVAVSALLPALRAGRLRTVEAISVGRAADGVRGRTARRLTGRLPLPRPVGLGLAHPFARPARSLTTAAAVAVAAVTVTFAAGLALSLGAVQSHRLLDSTAPVVVTVGGGQGPPGAQVVRGPGRPEKPAADPAEVAAVLRAQEGTRRFYGTARAEVGAAGVAGRTVVTGYEGDASWAAPDLVAGTWLTGPGQAVVTRRFLDAAGIGLGDRLTLTEAGRRTTVRVVGEAFFTENDGMTVLTPAGTLTALGLDAGPTGFYVQPDPGTSEDAYLASLNKALDALGAYAHPGGDGSSDVIAAMDALIGTLTLLLVTVAGLGVFSTVVLDTRDRVHELGVHKSLGMTPRQVVGMVLTSVAGIGVVASAAGIPLGVALHQRVTPLMGDAVGMDLPGAYLDVHTSPVLAVLLLGGVVVAVAGALVPAGRAARTDAAVALRTE